METHLDLALPNNSEHKKGSLRMEECAPENLEVGSVYHFLKKGHWNYEDGVQVTLMEIRGGEVLFDMRARVTILSTSFVIEDGQSYTKGEYQVEEILHG